LQRAISCGDAHEDTVAAYELARTRSREGQVYSRRHRGGRGRGTSSSQGFMCTSYVFLTMFMYSLYSYLVYVFIIFVLGLCIHYVGTWFMYAVFTWFMY